MPTGSIQGIIYPKKVLPEKGKQNNNKEDKYVAPSGNVTSKQAAFGEYESNISAQNSHVIKHETAHQSFAGRMASGSPHYVMLKDKDGRQVIIGGYQGIKSSKLANKNDSLKDISFAADSAKLVIAGAEAPKSFSALSGADEKIAASGRNLLAIAEKAKDHKNYLNLAFGINPEKQGTYEDIEQAKAKKLNIVG